MTDIPTVLTGQTFDDQPSQAPSTSIAGVTYQYIKDTPAVQPPTGVLNINELFDKWRASLVNQPEDFGMDGWDADDLTEVSIDTAAELLASVGLAGDAIFDDPSMNDLRAIIQSLVAIAQVATGHANQNEEL